MLEAYSPDVQWMVILGLVIAFILAFGIGANDVANSFGTSVGSGSLTLTKACILATICENAGAILIGQKVADTIRKGIVDVHIYVGSEKELMLGCIAALTSSAIFLLGSTFFKLPVSSTQSIIGSIVGFSLAARGTRGLGWIILGKTFVSWILSPLVSGAISVLFFLAIYKFILVRRNPLKAGLRSLPVFYAITVFVNTYSILLNGHKIFQVDLLQTSTVALILLGFTFGSALAVWLYVVPFQKEKILKEMILTSLNERIQEKKSAREAAGKTPIQITRKTFSAHNYFWRKSSVVPNVEYIPPSSLQPSESSTMRKRYTTASSRKRSISPLNLLLLDDESTEVVSQDNRVTSPPQNDVSKPSNKKTGNMASATPSEDELKLQRKIACKKADTIQMLFSYLQILSACFSGFAHGSNDVTNAIGPLVALYEIYVDGNVFQENEVPLFILFYGGLGISIGLWVQGRRVISTFEEDLTKITPVTGFVVSFCTAITLVISSDFGLPVSATHCLGGAIIAVGLINSRIARREDNATACMHAEDYGIDWKIFRSMAYAWFLTVPVTAALSAGVMYCFILFVLPII